MKNKINSFLFWLFLHLPKRMHKYLPQNIIDHIGTAANQQINDMQQEITRLKWQVAQKQADLLHLKNKEI